MPGEDDQDRGAAMPIQINLYPLQLLTAMVRHYAKTIRGAEYETLSDQHIVYREFDPPLRLNPADYWPKFEETIEVVQGAKRYLIKVPTFVAVHEAFLGSHAELAKEFVGQYHNFMERMYVYCRDSQGVNRRQEVLQRFQELAPEEQEEGIALVRTNWARGLLGNSFGRECLERIPPFLKKYPLHADAPYWRKQLIEANRLCRAFPVDQEMYKSVFDRYYSGLPGTGDPNVIQFLPRPPREKRLHEEVLEEPLIEAPVIRPPMQLEEDAVRAVPILEAGRRFSFYKTLGCRRVLRPKKIFGKEEHNYFGYLVRVIKVDTPTGLRQIIWRIYVDCDTFGCAVYIFDIDPNDPFRWIHDVQIPRKELRRIEALRHAPQPPDEDEAPTYFGREVHDKTFEQRIKRSHGMKELQTGE